MQLIRIPRKEIKPYREHNLFELYKTHFIPEAPYTEGSTSMVWDRVFGTWDYRPPWPYGGVTDFTRYKNVSFMEDGGMIMWVSKVKGERYTGARMSTMRRTGERCKAWGYTRWEADMDLPNDHNVVAAFWGLTKTHLQKEPIWSEKFQRWEKEKITPEFDWPETSSRQIKDLDEDLYNMAYIHGLTHYDPHRKAIGRRFPAVTGRHIWWIERRKNSIIYGIDGSIMFIQIGRIDPYPMYPIFWITVPDWAEFGYDPKDCNMKVYSFKVFENPPLKYHLTGKL